MAIVRVQGNLGANIDAAAGPISKAFSVDVTAGNLLVICLSKYSNTTNDPPVVGNISKSAGTATLGSFTLDKVASQLYAGAEYIHSAIFSAPVTGSGSCTISIAAGSATYYWSLSISEYSGVDVSGTRVDTTASNSGTSGTSGASGSFTTAGSSLIIAAGACDTGSSHQMTAGTSFTAVKT